MKKKDIIVIVGILLVALISFIVIELTKQKGSSVVVKIDGQTVQEISLLEDKQYELNGGTHLLCVEDGEAYLIKASCPDHVCIREGKISYNWQTITCIPYKLTITVTSNKQPSVELES